MTQLNLFNSTDFPDDSEVSDVRDFNVKFDLPLPVTPIWQNHELMMFRLFFMHEELNETMLAYAKRDMPKFFDGLIDLAYVVIGTAIMCGLPWRAGWKEVHEANMKKVRTANIHESKRASSYDIIKPAGWQSPDIDGILKQYGY